jgi:hypothetical protein
LPALRASCQCRPERIAAGRLDVDDPRAEAQQLAARERAGEQTGQVDDEQALERLHRSRFSHYSQGC